MGLAAAVHHITNANEDGSLPLGEEPNWTVPGFNNFRQNKQPDSERGAPTRSSPSPRCARSATTP